MTDTLEEAMAAQPRKSPRPAPKRRNEPPRRRLTSSLYLRLTPAELEVVRATAAEAGLSRNTIVRKAILAYAGLPTDLTPAPAESSKLSA